MPKTIIVPLDGSIPAAHAIPTGSWLAASFGADLHLVTARVGDDASARSILRHAELLADGPSTHTEVMTDHVPSSGILAAARSAPDPVICMSTRGCGALGSMLLGSVSEEVVRHAPVPVVLIGPRCRDVLDDPQDLVLCLTESSERAVMLPLANRWASELDLRLHVVQVLEPDEEPPGERELFVVGERPVKVGLTIDVRRDALGADDVTAGLAHGLDASLVMVATDGHNRELHGPTGHVATELVRHSHCPVVVRHLPD